MENNCVRGHIERNPTRDFSASDTDFIDPEYDPVDSSIEFHALDNIPNYEATDDDRRNLMVMSLESSLLGSSSGLMRITLRKTFSLIGILMMTRR